MRQLVSETNVTMAHQEPTSKHTSSNSASSDASSLEVPGLPLSSIAAVESCAFDSHSCLDVEIPTTSTCTDTSSRPTQLTDESRTNNLTHFNAPKPISSLMHIHKELQSALISSDRMSGDCLTNSIEHSSPAVSSCAVAQHNAVKERNSTESASTAKTAEQTNGSAVAASTTVAEAASAKIDDSVAIDSLLHDQPLSSDETPEQDKDTTSPRPGRKKKRLSALGSSTGRWTETEHQAFLNGLQLYGREWKKVATHIPTRTSAQVRSHAQKYFHKMQRDQQDPPTPATQSAAAPMATDALNLLDTDPSLSTSVRAEAARILAHPESVQQEVEETLHRLRQRYRNLQERLRRAQERNQREDDVSLLSASGVSQDLSPSVSAASLQNEELIALRVLQGGLDSSSRDSTPSQGGEPNGCDREYKEQEPHEDASTLSSKPPAKRPREDSDM